MSTPTVNSNPTSSEYVASLQSASNPASSAPNQKMGQAEFLRLLTTQLQNQDPNKPMDPTNFVTDLTQMSQLEATTQMNSSMQALATGFQSMQVLQSASMIGKNVQAVGDQMTHSKGEETDIKLSLDAPLKEVKIVITNKDGPVTEIEAGDLNKGDKVIKWDGKDSAGVESDSGQYTLTVFGKNDDGEIKSIKTVVPSAVKSIGVEKDGSMNVTLATGEIVKMEDIREIS